MRVNASQQLKGPIGSVRKYEVNEVVDVAEGRSRVRGEVELVRTDKGILARGTLDTEVEATCSRCLGLFRCPLTLSIEEEYYPTTNMVSGASLPPPEELGSFTIDEHHVIDLTEAVRQYILMAIPMKPLCRQDCAGLCPGCGQNLNQGSCGCPPQEIDSCWSELKKVLASDTVANERKGME
jgi:uncharacterized protein